MKTAILSMMMLMSVNAFAQVEHGNGGGEDGVFKGIRDEVGAWIQKNVTAGQLESKLELKSITGTDLKASFDQAVLTVGEKVVFIKDEIEFGENSRICKNENKTITCNVDAWNASRGDTRYMIVFHEYLGIAGIETNLETDYSRYPISSKIRKFVQVRTSFELGMEENTHQITAEELQQDYETVFSPRSRQEFKKLVKDKHQINFEFLSQPKFVSTDAIDQTRKYEFKFFEKVNQIVLTCNIAAKLKTTYPRQEAAKRNQAMMDEFRKNAFTELLEIDQAFLDKKITEGQQFRLNYLIDIYSNPQEYKMLVSIPVKSIDMKILLGLLDTALSKKDLNLAIENYKQIYGNSFNYEQYTQRALQERQQREQQEGQQQQQPQQQQAQAPIPETISTLVGYETKCEVEMLKGSPYGNDNFMNTQLYQYGVKHKMLSPVEGN